MEAIETQWRIATESPGDSKPRLPTPRGPGISDIKEDMLTNLTKFTKPCTIYRNNIISVIAYIPFFGNVNFESRSCDTDFSTPELKSS